MPCAVVECKGVVKPHKSGGYNGMRSRSVWLTWREKQLHAMGRHLTLEHLYVCVNCINAIDRSAGRGRYAKEKVEKERARKRADYAKRKRRAAAAATGDDDEVDNGDEAKEAKSKAKKCWKGHERQRTRIFVKAAFQQGKYGECFKAGQRSKDTSIKGMVETCRVKQ